MDCNPTTPRRVGRSAIATAAIATVLATTFVVAPAHAANTDIGYPTFSGSPTPVPDTGVAYTPGNQLQRIFDADLAAGAGSSASNDFWMDEMLARTGDAGSFGDNNQWLFTRGRAAFMKEHNPGVLGFGGQLAYWESIDGRSGYTITARVGGNDVGLTEDVSQRKQTPSYWRSVHRGGGIEVVQTKFITDANVLVTNLDVRSTGGAVDVELVASSPYAVTADGAELVGHVQALNNLTKISPRFSGDGFAPAGETLVRTLSVPAGGSTTAKVQLGLVTDEIAASRTEYDTTRAQSAGEAYTAHVTAYNEWWAENVPYLDTPEDNIDKTLYYRWWLMRYNFLDADMPGNTYQFPVAMEGVLGYNNSIVLTTGMFIDDLKYFRDPIYSYGPWVSTGETSKSYKFVDNPGDPANWSNSYTQYISEAAWRSYQLHGGPTAIAKNLAEYAEDDVKGLVDAYDTNGNGLIEYNWGAMTGNDADAVSFHWKGGNQDRAENAYLYSNALASAEAYRTAGDTAKADEMQAFAQNIKTQVMDVLWNPDRKLIEHAMANNGEHVPWKEINNYYPFSVGLVPKPGDADYKDDYVEALRLFADDKQYPIFPFYTANQADQAAYNATGGQGSNNFSVINSTVTFRMLSKVLRDYPTDAIDADWYKKLLYWNAWSHYQNGGDNRLPDQNEFWANGSADPQKIDYRSWIHHTILGATNFTMIEDAMGVRTRSDAKIELDPIDIGWDHFTANNIRYRDRDLSVTWDAPGGERHYGDDVPEGYSVFLDGTLAFTVDKLSHVVYDPATGTVEVVKGDAKVTTATASTVKAPQDVRFADEARVVDLFAKAGADVRTDSTGSANLATSATASFSAAGREPAGAVNGTTINEPFWGTAGSPNAKDSLTVELGGDKTFDDVRTYFYDSSSSATAAGYSEPSVYTLEVRRNGEWSTIPQQARTPAYPRANYNHVQFPEVTGDAVRLTATHAAGAKTGVKELQVFSTGIAAPASTNQAPLVTAWQDRQASAGGSAALVGTVKDDGLPGGELSARWSVVSAPEDATVLFDDAAAASTTARFSAKGEYVLRLSATDGEKTSESDVTVQGDVATQGANVAPAATPTASFTAGWNKVGSVNDGKILYNGGGSTDVWGTWAGGDNPATRWLQYDWSEPQRVSGVEMNFWSDQGDPASNQGVNVPSAWKVQYWDGAAWADVPAASAYTLERSAPNTVTFGAVTTTRLRATLSATGSGSTFAGVAVSEWKVFADAPTSIEPIDVRTTVGTKPELPATVDATFSDGSHADLPVTWVEVSDAQVAGEGSFTVSGIVPGSPVAAKATVWVRATAPGQINQVDAVTTRTLPGVAPVLPQKVGVLFNDGSRQDLPVTWNAVDPASYATAGQFTVAGTVQSDLPGTKAASAAVTVDGGGADTKAPTVALQVSPAAPGSGWYTQAVTVNVTATDDQDPAPRIEVRVGQGEWAAYTAAVSVTDDGSHVVQARATDATGNTSPVAAQTVRIDTTAPAAEVTADAVSRTVKATATDAGSGVASIEYRLGDAGDWSPMTGTVLIGLDETKVQVRSTDKAGNVSPVVERTVPKADGTQKRNVALLATPTASGTAGWNRVTGLNDDVQPTASGDVTPNDNANVWGVWPAVTDQWVQYDWKEPVRIGELGVYFVSNIDAQGLGIDVPASWKAEYWDATTTAWVPVKNAGAYGTAKDTYNTVSFEPVTTTKLRLALDPVGTEQGKGSVGIKEWQVWELPEASAPALDVAVSAASRAIAGKAYVITTAKNTDDVPVDLVFTSAYGTKTVKGVQPGKTVSASFNSRAASIPAGVATVTATATVGGAPVTATFEAPYGALN